MRMISDQYFRVSERSITSPEDPIGSNQMTPREEKRLRQEEKFSVILQEEESKRENFTATYWG